MRASRADATQAAIVAALRKCGASVALTHTMRDGFPDIVIGHRGVNYLAELKDGTKPPSQQALTEAQQAFHLKWNGYPVIVLKSVDQAVNWLSSLR